MIPLRSRGFHKEGDTSSLPVIQHHFGDSGEIWLTALHNTKNIMLRSYLKLLSDRHLYTLFN